MKGSSAVSLDRPSPPTAQSPHHYEAFNAPRRLRALFMSPSVPWALTVLVIAVGVLAAQTMAVHLLVERRPY